MDRDVCSTLMLCLSTILSAILSALIPDAMRTMRSWLGVSKALALAQKSTCNIIANLHFWLLVLCCIHVKDTGLLRFVDTSDLRHCACAYQGIRIHHKYADPCPVEITVTNTRKALQSSGQRGIGGVNKILACVGGSADV